jgi:hypothetical protein
MISKQWRERLTYTAMSVFVCWHTLAIVVAPASDSSVTVQSLRLLLQPYLTLFALDHKDDSWRFFAPEVNKPTLLRYLVKDASGKNHMFVPTAELNWLHPAYIWFRDLYGTILESPDDYGDTFASVFCREHASLRPVSIAILKIEQGEFQPEDHLNGKHPLDAEFVTVSTVKRVRCPRS